MHRQQRRVPEEDKMNAVTTRQINQVLRSTGLNIQAKTEYKNVSEDLTWTHYSVTVVTKNWKAVAEALDEAGINYDEEWPFDSRSMKFLISSCTFQKVGA
jgi:signal recognition particle subunit SEC65